MTDAPQSLSQALRGALAARKDATPNPAVEALAAAYADEIDGAEDRAKALELLGPKMLAALTALGMAAGQASTVLPPGRLTTSEGPAGAVDVLARMREQRRGGA